MEWRIETDPEGDPHTVCPKCGERDSIVEIDMATRWNTLRLTSASSAVASTGDGDWEFSEWFCRDCDAADLAAPEGFKITEWY